MDDNDININIDNSYGRIQININDGHLLIETCFWNVVNVYAQLKCKLFFDTLAVNVIHIWLYCMQYILI